MWRKIANWYREWEEEQIAVLEKPELASHAAQGYRRKLYCKLAERSPLERQQMRDFSLALKGWRGWAWTAVLVAAFTLCGAALHLFSPRIGWVAAIVSANACGIALMFALLGAWFNYRQMARRKLVLLLKVLVFAAFGALTSTALTMWLKGQPLAHLMERLSHFLGGVLAGSLAIMVPVLVISMLRNRQYEALNLQLQREAEQARLARELSESQLRLLRAQIEPHFLFNTLGAVQQLAYRGAPRAAELTANLIDFLRASLGDMRSDQVALKAEFGLVESYLKIMLVRLGEGRLGFRLELPPALEQVQVPSMILLTLAENAIKHGIEPALRGGEIVVSAALEQGALRLRVQDSGAGMSATPGKGLGLDNLRHRLRLTYGAAAVLTLQDADPGLVADIVLPAPEAGR
jgi:sensor histidine kinase YesM